MGNSKSKIQDELTNSKNENYILKNELEEVNKLNEQLQEELSSQNNCHNKKIIILSTKINELTEKINKYDECLDSYANLNYKIKK